MDTTIDTTADIVAHVCPEIEDISFTKEIAKTLILSTVTTAGMVAGLAAVGYGISKIQDLKQARRAKKSPVVTIVTETPENEK